MNKKQKKRIWAFVSAVVVVLLVRLGIYFANTNIPVLEPKGTIADKQLHLIVTALLLSVIVVVPVFIMLFIIAWKYRETNPKKAHYTPDWDGNRFMEITWWLIPSAIILVLSIITWDSSHQLDPFRPIASRAPAVHIQVIALDWKWLFIYPNDNIATVNYFRIPVNTPVDFDITSDAPMNSFWLPQLAGQIYAMPGMSTQLHIMANQNGRYNGSSANISGDGFSGMTFVAQATSSANYNSWLKSVQKSPKQLNFSTYQQLVKPSQYNPVAYYSKPTSNLYTWVVMKYMAPLASPAALSSTNLAGGGI